MYPSTPESDWPLQDTGQAEKAQLFSKGQLGEGAPVAHRNARPLERLKEAQYVAMLMPCLSESSAPVSSLAWSQPARHTSLKSSVRDVTSAALTFRKQHEAGC